MTTASVIPGEPFELQPDQEQLKAIYLTNTRERFKAEINRLTRGGMRELIQSEPDAEQLAFLMSYLYMYHWLRHNVPDSNYQADLLAAFSRGKQGFLMALLLKSADASAFIQGYIQHWLDAPPDNTPQQRLELFQLLASANHDPKRLSQRVLSLWNRQGLFTRNYAIAYKELARDERERYNAMLGSEDRERLALVDALPDPVSAQPKFNKLGLIPAMGCPQTCRHCMFIFRPLTKATPEPDALYQQVSELTQNVLFTGGDLTRQLDDFYRAIASMKQVTTFAILLNGDFAESRDQTRQTLESMARAIRTRPLHWLRAKVLLQISFDEFHQEVIIDKKGQLKERIPVRKIAHIVEAAPRFGEEIQLCLLHKQHALNFSMDLFHKGVFARLTQELGQRGHQVEVISASQSQRLKRNPLNPEQPAPVLKDASFILKDHPRYPIMLTSSTIDAYGRATMMDESEAVRERDFLQQVLNGDTTHGESFDKDIMFWFNGWATLFSAVHMCLGNIYEEGMDKILLRQRKDPLTQALHNFDLRLLDFYREKAGNLDHIMERSTGPHHLFHTITEDAGMRLHMTKRLLETHSQLT